MTFFNRLFSNRNLGNNDLTAIPKSPYLSLFRVSEIYAIYAEKWEAKQRMVVILDMFVSRTLGSELNSFETLVSGAILPNLLRIVIVRF